jgi:hypothetical protein
MGAKSDNSTMTFEVKVPSFVEDLESLEIHQQFLIAAARGLADKMQSIIAHPTLNQNCCDENGYNALHLAASRGYSEVVEILLLSGKINPQAVDKLGRHPIELAWKRGSRKVVEMIYQQMRSQCQESTKELGLWVFSQILFSNREDIFGQLQDLQKLKQNSPKYYSSLTQIEQKNFESSYWLNYS